MNHAVKIAPSLLSADFSNLGESVRQCKQAGAEILHVDVMDGHFVPNITIGPLVVAALRPVTDMILDCHLMIAEPERYIEAFAKAGADWISFHVEATAHVHRAVGMIREAGCRAGIVLNPATPLEFAFEAAEYCDFILLMSVNPGFGGQAFIPSFLPRCRELRKWLDAHELDHMEIEVDGGVKADNVRAVVEAGANLLVSGSGVFNGDISANFSAMQAEIAKAGVTTA